MSILQVRTRNGNYINVNELVANPGSFVSIRGYLNKKGEVSDYVINGSVTYESVLKESLENLENLHRFDDQVTNFCFENSLTQEEILVVRDSLTNKWILDLNKEPEEIEEESLYVNIAPGLRYKDSMFYLWGLVVKKTVRVSVEKREKNSRTATKIKEFLMSLCPVSNYRQFVLAGNFDTITMNNKRLGTKSR